MRKVRQSNIELLRIIAMMMICIIHANMVSLVRPVSAELMNHPLPTITRYLIESFGIVGVDIFVFISGWFTIKTSSIKLLSFLFQVVYCWGGGFFLFWFLGRTELNLSNVLGIVSFTSWDWFIKSYIVLMIIAPILNTFVENSSERQQRYVLIGFFLFSSSYGWLGGANRFFVSGYGPLLWIGIYLLAQYAHHTVKEEGTPQEIRKFLALNRYLDLLIFIASVLVNTLIGIIGLYYGMEGVYGIIYAYTNPFTIIGGLYLFLFFSKLTVKPNKVINILAAGSFAVYLLHSQIDIRPYFTQGVQYLFNSHNGISCIIVILFYLILVYAFSVIIDMPRMLIWNKLSKK